LVERAFRCLKGLDLLVRPIRHRVEPRVRAHILLCMLAYYVLRAKRTYFGLGIFRGGS
jgi:transposase